MEKSRHITIHNEREILSVAQLNRQARLLLESEFPGISVSGELSNMARPSSGHWYFTLKDEQAQIRCAMFRNRNQYLNFAPENGLQIIAKGKISLYEGRGDFQLIVEAMEPFGDGLLRQQFEKLKQQLQSKGWFAADRKQALPTIPKCIGIITSSTGAAVKDILKVLKRRFPAIPVIIYPTQVQGKQAAEQIAQTIQFANRHQACDTLILARGGGSLEDLWAFNELIVAEAIYQSELPIITGIGHEVDFTIADFVADQRAPTPSVAAELATPDKQVLLAQTQALAARLRRVIMHQLQLYKNHLVYCRKRLQSPMQRLQQQSQRLDHLELRMQKAWQYYHQQCRSRLASLARALDAVSPLATLDRGFAIVSDTEQKIIHSIKNCEIGQLVYTRVSDGTLECEIKKRSALVKDEL